MTSHELPSSVEVNPSSNPPTIRFNMELAGINRPDYTGPSKYIPQINLPMTHASDINEYPSHNNYDPKQDPYGPDKNNNHNRDLGYEGRQLR